MKVLWTIAITTVLYIGHCTVDSCENTCEAEEVCLDIMNGTCVNRSELVSCDYSSFCYKGQKCCKWHEYCIPENAECCGDGYCEENHECCGMKKCCWPGDHCFVNTCIRGGQPGPLPTKSARSTPKTRMSVSTKTTTRPTSKTRTSVSRTTTTRIVFQWWYGVIAGVVLLTALAAIVFCQRKRKTRRPNGGIKECESAETSGQRDCGFYYCEKGYDCCPFYHCIPEGSDCCGAGKYCEKGQTCCGILHCCEAGYYCDAGSCKIYRGTYLTTRWWTSTQVEMTTRWTRSWTTGDIATVTLYTMGHEGGSSWNSSLYLLCMIPVLIGIICVIFVVCRRAICKSMVPRPRSDIYLTGYTERQRQIQTASNNTHGMIFTSPTAVQPYVVETGGNVVRNTTDTNQAFSKPPPSYEDVVSARY